MELIIVVVGMCIAFYLGSNTTKEKKITTLNPVKIIEEKKELKRAEKENEKQNEIFKTIADNIDNYNGTATGQKDIPR